MKQNTYFQWSEADIDSVTGRDKGRFAFKRSTPVELTDARLLDQSDVFRRVRLMGIVRDRARSPAL
jgi:hypothetical protein